MNVHLMQTLGFDFEESTSGGEPFGVFNLVQGVSAFVAGFIQDSIDVTSGQSLIIYIIVVGILGSISCIIGYFFPYAHDKNDIISEMSLRYS